MEVMGCQVQAIGKAIRPLTSSEVMAPTGSPLELPMAHTIL